MDKVQGALLAYLAVHLMSAMMDDTNRIMVGNKYSDGRCKKPMEEVESWREGNVTENLFFQWKEKRDKRYPALAESRGTQYRALMPEM